MKKICFLCFFLVVVLSGCPNNPFTLEEASLANLGNLKINISQELEKASINIGSAQVTKADISLIAPDLSVQTKTWYVGGASVFYYSADLTGSYTISVTETDSSNTVTSTNIQAVFEAGYNYYITLNVGGHVFVKVTNI